MRTAVNVLFLLVLAYSSFGQTEAPLICKDLSTIVQQEQQRGDELLNFRVNELTRNYDLKYHRMELNLDPSTAYISGKITSYFVANEDGFSAINFDFRDNMEVLAVSYHGDNLNWTLSNDNLQIPLPSPLPARQQLSLEVHNQNPHIKGIEIAATDGKILMRQNSTTLPATVNIEHLPPGTYLCSVLLNDGKVVRRFVKH